MEVPHVELKNGQQELTSWALDIVLTIRRVFGFFEKGISNQESRLTNPRMTQGLLSTVQGYQLENVGKRASGM